MHDIALVSYALFKNRDAATKSSQSCFKRNTVEFRSRSEEIFLLMRVDSSYQNEGNIYTGDLWRVAAKVAIR